MVFVIDKLKYDTEKNGFSVRQNKRKGGFNWV